MKNDTTIHADEPIDSKSKDSLGRSRLVEIVTRHVLATDEKHSMVIGLNAPWGAGKSSFLNLLQNHLLAKENPSPPIVIRFNPWLYKDIDQITYSFFDELARGIGMGKENEKKKEKKKEIVKNLKSLGKLTTGIASPFFPRSTIWLSNLIDYIPSPDAPTLVESREKLNSSLGELDQRVVVLIDDLDRMEKDSVLTLLKMVRLNANLANITYVLAFDRQIIEKQLDEENGISGRNYLDKIVQLPFDLPAPEPEIINGILFGHIYEVIESSETREWNQNRWRQISIAGFGYHFQTIRQVKRYTNALQTRLSAIREEVDPVDFIAIELVRVFHPDAYQEIAEAGALLTGKWTKQGDISLMMDDGDKLEEAKEQFLKRVRNNSSNNLRDTVVEILKRVFPRLHSTSYDDSSHAQWSRECRICSPDHF
ncbi:MAG: KAP family NTPase, partial [Alphaproteobacteria bacterium]